MSEDEIIKNLNDLLEHNYLEDVYYLREENDYVVYNNAIQGLLDLYQKEKEKNKEAIQKAFEDGQISIVNRYISKDKIKEFIEENTRTGRGYNEYEEGLIDENDRIIDKLSKMIEEN